MGALGRLAAGENEQSGSEDNEASNRERAEVANDREYGLLLLATVCRAESQEHAADHGDQDPAGSKSNLQAPAASDERQLRHGSERR